MKGKVVASIEDKLYLVHYKHAKESHITLDQSLCKRCEIGRVCLTLCPAKVYQQAEDKDEITLNFENCLECGTCRVACTMDAIDWKNPPGGFGVNYRYG